MKEWFWPQYAFVAYLIVSFLCAVFICARKDTASDGLIYVTLWLGVSGMLVLILTAGGFF